MNIKLVTRCTRGEKLNELQKTIRDAWFKDGRENDTLTHIIVFDKCKIKNIDLSLIDSDTLIDTQFHFYTGTEGDMGHGLLNKIIDKLSDDDWICFVDDDNEVHPEYFDAILSVNKSNPDIQGIIVSQLVYFNENEIMLREAKHENTKVYHVDMGQFVLRKSIIGNTRFERMKYEADGIFIEEIYNKNPNFFYFISNPVSYYNKSRYSVASTEKLTNKSYSLPRILLLDHKEEILSKQDQDYESRELNVLYSTNETVIQDIQKFDPDSIVTVNESFDKYINLMNSSYEVRRKWIHRFQEDEHIGEVAYQNGMHYILTSNETLISIITPMYNTGEKLKRTYSSLVQQTYDNWEWILVNDSTDSITIEIANEIAKNDPRVKVYDIYPRTKGIIGESKYRASCLSTGAYILELDHDDYLLSHALQKMIEAFDTYPDAGFCYSDCAEIDENFNSLTYNDGFCFGYGKYRDEEHLGKVLKVVDSSNINPLTIRHIVGVPNHFRSWRRKTYFDIGGHNRRLSIADDFELLIRTFLNTKFIKIDKCCYLQFYHNNNTQNSTRADIQRRVKTIAIHYNDRIKERFEELGKTDWAYIPNSTSWYNFPRFGDEENHVNYRI